MSDIHPLVERPPRSVVAVVGVLLVVAPLVLPSFQTYLLTEVLALALFATGFNLLYGYTGLLSFGHAMFFGSAGYTVGIFMRDVAPASDSVGRRRSSAS